jgi:putative membrane protein
MRVALICAGVVVAVSAHVGAHDGELAHSPTAAGALSSWDFMAVALLALAGGAYVVGLWRLRQREVTPPRLERAAFFFGWASLLIAVLPPLDGLSTQRFSAHMLQHELMMLVGAPLVIAGRPLPVWLWGLPSTWRIPVGNVFRRSRVGGVWYALTAPLVAWVLHGLALWLWHIPALYDAAVANEGIHALQHAIFVGTSCLFWWGLLYGRYGRAGYGAAVFYVFTTVIHTGLLGAILTFAGRPFYPVYRGPAQAGGIDPVADQQIAGLLMWIPAGAILTLLGLGFFAAWIGAAGRRQRVINPAIAGTDKL